MGVFAVGGRSGYRPRRRPAQCRTGGGGVDRSELLPIGRRVAYWRRRRGTPRRSCRRPRSVTG
ncbi:hypothetical protein F8271_07355 [Micromonospora sp. ALFpr18c]|nr:hypothetical protein F8271_07355 [Micromonospora sp. ALFpr18c]